MICLPASNALLLARRQYSPARVLVTVRTRRVQPLRAADGAGDKPGDGQVDRSIEDAFAKELQRRRMSTDSIDSDSERSDASASASSSSRSSAGTNPFAASSSSPPQTRTRPRAPPPPMTEGQRERSMEMVNEGLEGLIPRASQLLQLGFSAFLPFLPFMLAFSLLFTGIFFVFGDSFLHGGRQDMRLPQYVDPQTLLSEPTVDPYVPYQAPTP